MTRNTIVLPLNSDEQFNRGTTGSVLAAPTNVTAAPGNQSIVVEWDEDTLSSGYRIFYDTSPITDIDDATRITITDPNTSTYTITGLDNGTAYYIRMVTVNGAGYSSLSTEVSATPSFFNNVFSTEFDGLTEYMTNTTTSDFDFDKTDPFSISCWVKFPTGALVVDNTIFSNLNTGANFEGIELALTGGNVYQFYFIKTVGSDQIRVTATSGLTEDTWYHVCMTYDGSNAGSGVTLYTDAVSKTTSTPSPGPISGTMNSWGNNTIVARENGTKLGELFLDELAFYDKELTSTEVEEIYNEGIPNRLDSLTTASNLISWFRMGDDDTNTKVLDNVGSNDFDWVNGGSSNYKTDVPS